MWSYYGAKTNIVKLYPPPIYTKIIEPFAGSARYSLRYFDRDVILVDKYPVIVRIWKWLQQCSEKDIISLPRLKYGETLNDFDICEEAKLLLGFIVAKGVSTPQLKATKLATSDRQNHINFSLSRISKSLFKIKHWEIKLGSYEDIDNNEATWFIDPPYQFGGEYYVKSSKKIDFNHLAIWAQERKGQVIVCENTRALWMPFKPLKTNHGIKGDRMEAIWCNMPTSYDSIQQRLF